MIYKASYEKDDLVKMADMGKENYGDANDISKVEYLEWQCYQNPAGDACIALAFEDESGRLIGESMQIPCELRAFGEKMTAAHSVNTLIRKKNRSLAVFYDLHKLSFDLCSKNVLSYAVPNPNSYPLFCKIFSCVTAAHIPLMVLPMRPKALIKAKISKKLAAFVPDIVIKGKGQKASSGIRVSKISQDEVQVLNDLWPLVMDKYKIMGIRSSEYFIWRYFSNPCNSYSVFMVWKDASPAGFAVLRIMELDGIKTGMLVDFLMIPKHEAEARALLAYCMDYFNAQGVELVGALMLPHCEEYRLLQKSGFLVCPKRFLPQPFPFILKTFREDSGKYEKAENWFITMGDYDAV